VAASRTTSSVVPRLTKEELKQRLEGPVEAQPVIIDVRLKYPYEHSTLTLPGALRFLPDSIDTSRLPRDRDIVLYDSDPEELVSAKAASDLIRQGFRALALRGGIADWVTAKFPTASKPAPQASAPAPGALKG
jgi:rhodanese-related sulfurtransferase